MNTKNVPARSLFAAVLAIAALTLGPASAQPPEEDPKIHLLVSLQLRPGIDINTFNARYGSETEHEIASRRIYAVSIPDTGEKRVEENFAEMVAPDVEWAEPTYLGDGPEGSGRNFYCTILPNAAAYNNQAAWGQINLGAAHKVSTGDGVNVAIIDTGLDVNHREMAGRVLSGGWNFVEGNDDISDVGDGIDNDGDGDIDELTGHGTHMAGIVAKIAPGAMILPIKVLDSDGNTHTFKIAQGIFYAVDQGVDVINLSIGSTYDAIPVEEALDEAREAGIVVTGAAGNVDTEHERWEFPALREEAIGVVAVDENDIKAEFTNVNELFALSAPGVHIWSTIPDNLYADLDGTSPATAMVSGTAALLLSAHPDWFRGETRVVSVERYLTQSALDIDPLNPEFATKLGDGRLDAGGALNVSVAFDPPLRFPTGAFPTAVAAADLDGDFLSDLAVVNALGNSISVLRNDGSGSFTPVADYPVGSSPEDVVAAKLNRDDRPDLAVPNSSSNTVSVLLNNGDATFAAAISYPVGLDPSAIAAGDFDNDGDTDLAVTNQDSGDVSILLNDGFGAFSPGGTFTVGVRPRDIVAAHLNGDDRLDLATVNRRSDNVSILINLGGGSFAPAVHLPVGADPRFLVAADFDGDDHIDLVTSNSDTKDMSLLLNNGNGTFAPATPIDLFGGIGPGAMATGDFDCDNDIDIATLRGDAPGTLVSIVLNDGTAVFGELLDFALAPDDSPENMAAADLDNDGDVDLAIAESSTDSVVTLINQTCALIFHGDLNCDGTIDALDIEPFILALFNPAAYENAYPECSIGRGDLNRDGFVDALDIEPFIQLLFGG